MLKKIWLILLGTLLLLVPSAHAITKRTDKECLLCHVLWFDAFKTDQKTLVEQKQTDIVVAGSIGLVSTEAMCITCHDGYVADSRNTVMAANPHHELKKPPPAMQLPELLRLDSKNKIYCGTCHTLHDFEDRADVGSTPFMRMDNQASQMCIACHGDASRKKPGANHPLNINTDTRTLANAAKMGAKFGPDQKMICQSCHNAHGQRALLSPTDNSSLCLGCHRKQSSLIDSRHDIRSKLPKVKNIKQQTPAQSGPCGACHVPHNAVGKKLWARPLKKGGLPSQMCLTCHGPDAGIEIKGIGSHSHPVDIKPAAKDAVSKKLPLFRADATKAADGRIQCFTCHDVHRWNPKPSAAIGDPRTEGDSSNSFLRMANDGASALCVACHKDKQQLLSSDHNLRITAPAEKNVHSQTAAQAGPCGACHVPHNAAPKRLWARPSTAEDNWVNQVCIACHNAQGAAKEKWIGKNTHPVDVDLNSLGPAVRLADIHRILPLYSPDGIQAADQHMVCLTCHDPHTWRPQPATGPQAPYTANVEGTAKDSFLRAENYPKPDLCTTCHIDHARIEGSPHDLRISAPEATNIVGQTVNESGTCGVCHMVHNSPNALRLWARDLGQVTEDVNIVGALCTGCHSKGNPGEKKIPAVASHPSDKLIRAHRGNVRGKAGDTPVFDDKGIRQEVGNLGCPSCHNGHWGTASPKAQTKGKAAADGKTARFRFLRNHSTNAICMECHGPEGLFRYLYFHDPAKRGIWVRPRQAHDRSRISVD